MTSHESLSAQGRLCFITRGALLAQHGHLLPLTPATHARRGRPVFLAPSLACAGGAAARAWLQEIGAPGAAAAPMGAARPTGLLEVGEESMAGGMEVRPPTPDSGDGTSRVVEPSMAEICRAKGACGGGAEAVGC